MRHFVYGICLFSTVTAAQAAPYVETDFRQQSKFCEAATRLPWGDVDQNGWADCMMHQQVRSPEVREKDLAQPRTPWFTAYRKSLLDATDDGCQLWAGKQPTDPPRMRRPGVVYTNHAWNLCMERQGLFVPPPGRTPQENKAPDFRAMAAEQRQTTVTNETYGCADRKHYDEITERLVSFFNVSESNGRFTFRSADEMERKTRELVLADPACRMWTNDEKVRVKAEDDGMLCLEPAGVGRCFWSERTTINAWE